ncbi:MAG: methylated-DNA--[protein]-cysteine S-methyltransferase [Actinomycetota bacterium]|nr:methylated-DNA--[protein]-cysteine S-methyltransferase [Actinomycetota bacterium]
MSSIETALRTGPPVARGPGHPGADPADGFLAAAAAAGLLDVAYTVEDTAVGRLVLARTERGLLACSYADEETVLERVASRVSPRVLRAPARLDDVRRELDAYLAGRLRAFTVPVDLGLAGEFGRAVLHRTAALGYGQTTTYAELARAIGRPGAARAVGNALGANPVCVVVPCHRVLRAGGGLGGYAGGVAVKARLLALEDVGS